MIRRPTLSLALVAVMAAAGCSSAGATNALTHAAPASVAPPTTMMASMPRMSPDGAMGAPDRPVAGPQGRVAQFLVECPFSHALADDPIVFPGRPGQSHMHDFFGNASADAASTYASLLAGHSNCDQGLDTASYWAPAMIDDGRTLVPTKSVAYYRPGEGVDPTTVQSYPSGLKMIAGNAGAEGPQPTSVVAFTCGAGIARDAAPPTCPADRPLRMLVTFPDCWDGVHTDSDDHRSHMAYSSHGSCPSTHPVAVPQLQFSVAYPFSGDPSRLSLASGPIFTGHADFFNAWNEAKLTNEIDECIHRKVVCGVTSGRK